MIVSENEVYQIVKKSCISEKIYEDWADDIGKAIALLQKNNIDGCEEFKNLINITAFKKHISIKQEKNKLVDLHSQWNAELKPTRFPTLGNHKWWIKNKLEGQGK